MIKISNKNVITFALFITVGAMMTSMLSNEVNAQVIANGQISYESGDSSATATGQLGGAPNGGPNAADTYQTQASLTLQQSSGYSKLVGPNDHLVKPPGLQTLGGTVTYSGTSPIYQGNGGVNFQLTQSGSTLPDDQRTFTFNENALDHNGFVNDVSSEYLSSSYDLIEYNNGDLNQGTTDPVNVYKVLVDGDIVDNVNPSP